MGIYSKQCHIYIYGIKLYWSCSQYSEKGETLSSQIPDSPLVNFISSSASSVLSDITRLQNQQHHVPQSNWNPRVSVKASYATGSDWWTLHNFNSSFQVTKFFYSEHCIFFFFKKLWTMSKQAACTSSPAPSSLAAASPPRELQLHWQPLPLRVLPYRLHMP